MAITWTLLICFLSARHSQAYKNSIIPEEIRIPRLDFSELEEQNSSEEAPQDSPFEEKVPVNFSKEEELAYRFVKKHVQGEAKFFREARQDGIALDGIDFNKQGAVVRKRLWTAASKEAIDLMLITRVLSGNEWAIRLYANGKNDKKEAVRYCLKILNKKIRTYELFKKTYPRYAGFLPWITYREGRWKPSPDWVDRVPALDNGEWLWAIYGLLQVLPKYDKHLERKFQNYYDQTIKNLKLVFWEGSTNHIRAEAHIITTQDKKDPYIYINNINGYYLNDLYEGILMTYLFIMNDLLTQEEEATLIEDRVVDINQSQWGTTYYLWPRQPDGDGSAHTKWSQYVVPETDDLYISLFNWRQECVRASVNTYGFPSSCTEPVLYGGGYTGYRKSVLTPYGASSLIFLSTVLSGSVTKLNQGLIWLMNMVDKTSVPSMVNSDYGMYESLAVNLQTGQLQDIAHIGTYDVKGLTMVAITGGVIEEVRSHLKVDGKYKKFMDLVRLCYKKVVDEAEPNPSWETLETLRSQIQSPKRIKK